MASPVPADLESREPMGVVSMPMSKRAWPPWNHASTRGTVLSPITNGYAVMTNLANLPASYYYAAIQVGTPPQLLQVVMDTGSSDFVVKGTKYCGTEYGTFCYNQTASSTAQKANLPKFVGQYGGQAGGQTDLNGTFYSDTVLIGGTRLKNIDMAVVNSNTYKQFGGGLMGLAYPVVEATNSNSVKNVTYPQVLDILYQSGHIKSHAFSLYLDNLFALSGAIIFGGYDAAKFDGALVALSMVPYSGILAVNWTSTSFTDSKGSTSSPVIHKLPQTAILDSGTPTAYLPNATVVSIIKHIESLGYTVDDGYVDCALAQAAGSVNVEFADTHTGASVQIAVPWSELTIPTAGGLCELGLTVGDPDQIIFGDTFMRSMYAVFNMDNSTISLARANFNSQGSKIVAIE